MQASHSASTVQLRRPHWAAFLALIHGFLYLAWYRGQALGQVPVLDGRELIELAVAYAHGNVDGPFYRGPLYAWLLAIPLRLGLPEGLLLPLAQLINMVLHALTTVLVFGVAKGMWRSTKAAMLASCIWALYPVAVFFAGDSLDVTLAITLMMAALLCWQKSLAADRKLRWLLAMVSGLMMALAFAARPHMLAAGVGLALASAVIASRWLKLAYPTGLLLGLLLIAGANYWQSGVFRLMPSQGGYNLWAANGPQANGRYFQQTEPSWRLSNSANPARQEALIVYRKMHQLGDEVMPQESDVDRYWRERALRYMIDRPGAWLKLLTHKLLALLHNTEQYNNKTYALHRATSPILRWNPLSWAVLVVLAMLALCLAPGRAAVSTWGVFSSAVFFAAGVVVYYSSARFRLPLAALLSVCVGGLMVLAPVSRLRLRWCLPVATVLGVLLFWPFPWAKPENTFGEDWMLIASANDQLGHYPQARTAANRAIQFSPGQAKPLQVLCAVEFNAALSRWSQGGEPQVSQEFLDACQRAAQRSPLGGWSHALALWVAGDRTQAVRRWQEMASLGGAVSERAVACLLLAGEDIAPRLSSDRPYSDQVDLLLYARAARGDSQAYAELVTRVGAQVTERELKFYLGLFGPVDASKGVE